MESYQDYDPNSSENALEEGWINPRPQCAPLTPAEQSALDREYQTWITSVDPNGSIESESGY